MILPEVFLKPPPDGTRYMDKLRLGWWSNEVRKIMRDLFRHPKVCEITEKRLEELMLYGSTQTPVSDLHAAYTAAFEDMQNGKWTTEEGIKFMHESRKKAIAGIKAMIKEFSND